MSKCAKNPERKVEFALMSLVYHLSPDNFMDWLKMAADCLDLTAPAAADIGACLAFHNKFIHHVHDVFGDAARDPLYPADHFDAMMRYAIDTAARRGVCDGLHVDLATGGASVVRRPGAPPKHLYDVAATFRDARRGEPC